MGSSKRQYNLLMRKIWMMIVFFGMLTSLGTASVLNPGMEKMYAKEYYSNGNLKAEGWEMEDHRVGYWKFYHLNGTVSSEGHFSIDKKHGYWHYFNGEGILIKEGHYENGTAEDWWIFYDIANSKTDKFQYKNNKKNGFSLHYRSGKLVKAKKYSDDEEKGEWTSLFAFRRDNPSILF